MSLIRNLLNMEQTVRIHFKWIVLLESDRRRGIALLLVNLMSSSTQNATV